MLPAGITESMPSDYSEGLDGLSNPQLKNKEELRSITQGSSSNRSNKFGWLPTCPAQNVRKRFYLSGSPVMSNLSGDLPLKVSQALLSISAATIDRLLHSVRIQYKTRVRATTNPGTLLRKHIPIKTNQWDESRPGFPEADTVAHCGQSLSGMFAYTIDCVDIATGWSEQRAVWAKGETAVLEQIKQIEKSLPFPCSASIQIMDLNS